MASARLQRWALSLGAYSYTIQHKSGKDNVVADALSRIPLEQSPSEVPIPGETILLIETLDSTPINVRQIAKWTNEDVVLSRVHNMVLKGWMNTNDPKFLPYQNRKNELSVQSGCILWGSRVVVPKQGQKKTLELLHEGHLGISRMKAKARGIDHDVEKIVKGCAECQHIRHSEIPVPHTPWEPSRERWRRIHIDYAGPFRGKMFLLVVDSYSKWLDVAIVNSANTTSTVERLRNIFATHGLPDTLVSDNGSVFTCEEFQLLFLKRNGIRHIKTVPYHPASNGQVERTVQTFKEFMKKCKTGTLETQVSRFLFSYRTTTHSTTGQTPAERLMGRRLRTLLHPDLVTVEGRKREVTDIKKKGKTCSVDETVWIQDLPDKTWIPGIIISKQGTKMYVVELTDGRVVRRHVDHIRHREISEEEETRDFDVTTRRDDVVENEPANTEEIIADEVAGPENITLRRSTRSRQPPERYAPGYTHLLREEECSN